jgi:serine/threonine protein kinase
MKDELIGTNIGGYEILARLGQGGMASVYRARQTSMNRIVALKILPRHFMRDDTYLQRFEREVRIVAQLEHRNIVPVHDYGEHDGQPYIAMRYMSGGSVDDRLRDGPLDLDTILSIIQQIAPALDYAHSKNVLHRDLKPSNILMDDDGGAYLTDFGIARILGVESNDAVTLTTQGVVGTPSYMSPEQAQGHALDGRSDIYSLGVTLFEMATGRRPFENETPYGIAVMQVTTPPPSPRNINPEVPGSVEQVVLKALKKRADNRYQTALQLAEALRLAIERPHSLHDTQPRALPVQQALAASQQANSQQTVPSAPAGVSATPPPPPVYAPPPPSQAQRSVGIRAKVRKRRTQGNFWISVIIGGLIGCGLLSAIVVAAIMAITSFLGGSSAPTPTTRPLPTLDPTSEAGRQALFAGPGLPEAGEGTLPVFINVTPIPTRTPPAEHSPTADPDAPPTATPDPELGAEPGSILYFARRGGSYDLFEFDLSTGYEIRLAGNDADNSHPAGSPDGGRVVFQSNREGVYDLYVLERASGEITRLTASGVDERLPSWSPDGEWIVYAGDTRGDGAYDLYRVSAAGGEPELILSNGQRNSHPRYSHDGRYIVFTSGERGDATTWEIMRLDLASGEVLALTDNEVRDASPVFSPDDRHILYLTEGDGGAAIARMNADGSGARQLLRDGPGFVSGAGYSPDGEFIVFDEASGDRSLLYLMRVDGSGVRELSAAGGVYPSWLP